MEKVYSYLAVVVIGTDQVQICTLKEGLAFVQFFYTKGRASRLVRVSTERTMDITPDYVRSTWPHLFPTEITTKG